MQRQKNACPDNKTLRTTGAIIGNW